MLLLSPFAIESRDSIKKVLPRIMVANFNGNFSTAVTCCYSPTPMLQKRMMCCTFIKNNQLLLELFLSKMYQSLKDFLMHTSEKSTPTIEPSITKQPMEMAFIFVNLLLKMNYVFSTLIFKKSIGKLWPFQHPNSSKTQLDHMLKNQKCRNNCVNAEV